MWRKKAYAYPLFKKKPPKSIIGIINGEEIVKATFRFLAAHEIKYPEKKKVQPFFLIANWH